jgi:hypothetical protein
MEKIACYMPEEHEDFERLLANEHLVDAYRILYPAICETFDIKERGIFTTRSYLTLEHNYRGQT